MSSNEWYTPSKYIEAARAVMGSIDLDPASCEEANQTVKAARYYTKEENGLLLPWYGNVWVNPPYGKTSTGKSNVWAFVERLQESYLFGDVEQAIILTTCAVYTKWFEHLWQYTICFPRRRINFGRGEWAGPAMSNICGSAFTYFGQNEQRFIEVFSQFGHVAKSYSPRVPVSFNHTLVISP